MAARSELMDLLLLAGGIYIFIQWSKRDEDQKLSEDLPLDDEPVPTELQQ